MSQAKVLGIIGGGQLGSMLCQAAKKVNIKTVIYCDDKNAPAQNFSDQFINSSYENINKITEFSNLVDVVTFEFENIPVPTLEIIKKIKSVYPDPQVNFIIQNRSREKDFINKSGIKTVNYKNINSAEDLKQVDQLVPGILKTTTLGYDGKGQVVINETDDLKKISFENEYILEEKIKLNKEISVIVTRYQNGECVIYDPIENIHYDQILDTSTVPAEVDGDIIRLSKDYAKTLATKLNYIGTMCVEYFINDQKELLVNEIAPRVHNSGHLTINAYNISQFESHVRAVCNLEKIEPKLKINAQMKNIIGEDIFKYREQKFKSNEYFFDYLKTEVKPKRKMGHLTTTQD